MLSEIQYTPEEDLALLDSVNDTGAPMLHGDIMDGFRIRLKEHPDSVYVTYRGKAYTTREADAVSGSIAAALVRSGISPGDRVAVLVPRSEWFSICSLAVVKTGA